MPLMHPDLVKYLRSFGTLHSLSTVQVKQLRTNNTNTCYNVTKNRHHIFFTVRLIALNKNIEL